MELIIEKGPRQGETLQYICRSVVKIGRVARGNTVAIKDAGISSKHICIKFDIQSNKLVRLVLNGKTLTPNFPFVLNDNDCIKIGDFTSIVVKLCVESSVRSDRKCKFEGGTKSDGEMERFGENLGENVVRKKNFPSRVKKGVSFKNDLVDFVSVGKQVIEHLNVDVSKVMEDCVAVEPRMTRGMKRKLSVQQPAECLDIDERKPAVAKRTRRGRKEVTPEGNLDNVDECVQIDERNEIAKDGSEDAGSCDVEETVNRNNESAQDGVVKDTSHWCSLEKMTLGDFFDYLEVQLPKEIHDKTDNVVTDLLVTAQKCHELRLERIKSSMRKLTTC